MSNLKLKYAYTNLVLIFYILLVKLMLHELKQHNSSFSAIWCKQSIKPFQEQLLAAAY